MSLCRIPHFYDRDGRVRRTDPHAVYFIVAQQGDGVVVVKIGFSSNMYARYNQLLCGIPFESVMYFSWIGSSSETRRLEYRLHKMFESKRLRGEWFRFAESEMQGVFEASGREIAKVTARQPEWRTVSDAQAIEYLVQTKSKGRAA